MFPESIEQEISIETSETTNLGKSFLFNFESGDFVLKDGKLVEITGTEALKVWIEKVIRTEKFRFKIYEREDHDEYGVTIEDLVVGRDYPPAFVESELRRELSDAMTKHPMISSLSEFKVNKENPKVTVSFTVNLVNNSSFTQEVSL